MSADRDGVPVSTEVLGEEIAALAARIGSAMCRWLLLVAEFDARDGWHGQGLTSCAHWLQFRCGLSPGTAREHLRVARWLAGFPLVQQGFTRGELTYSKVRALSRLGHLLEEAEVVEMGRQACAVRLERIVRATRAVRREEAADAIAERRLSLHPEPDGTWTIRGRLTPEDGERLAAALAATERELFPLPTARPRTALEPEREPVPGPARRADALVHLAVGGGAAALEPAATEVVVHVDVATLADEDDEAPDAADRVAAAERRCHTGAGVGLAAATARRLCCDGGVVAVAERDGEVLSVGRRTRAIPPAIRRALAARGEVCAFPGCERRRWLDAHHVVHWAHGGETRLSNLVLLCRHHHRLLHEGDWELVRGEGDRWLARSPHGWLLTPEPPPPPGTTARGLTSTDAPDDLDGDDLVALSAGQRWDLGLAVDAMLRWTEPEDEPDEPEDEPEPGERDADEGPRPG